MFRHYIILVIMFLDSLFYCAKREWYRRSPTALCWSIRERSALKRVDILKLRSLRLSVMIIATVCSNELLMKRAVYVLMDMVTTRNLDAVSYTFYVLSNRSSLMADMHRSGIYHYRCY